MYSLQSEVPASPLEESKCAPFSLSASNHLKSTLNSNVVSQNASLHGYVPTSGGFRMPAQRFPPQLNDLSPAFYPFHPPKPSLMRMSPGMMQSMGMGVARGRVPLQRQNEFQQMGNSGWAKSMNDIGSLSQNNRKPLSFPSEFSLLSGLSNQEISPLSHFNDGARDFKKGKINSDICIGKSVGVDQELSQTSGQNQTNLTERFKQMNLKPKSKLKFKSKLKVGRKVESGQVEKDLEKSQKETLREPFKEIKNQLKNGGNAKNDGNSKRKKGVFRNRRRRGKRRYHQVKDKFSQKTNEISLQQEKENQKNDQHYFKKEHETKRQQSNYQNNESRNEHSQAFKWRVKTPQKTRDMSISVQDSSQKKGRGGFSLMPNSFMENFHLDLRESKEEIMPVVESKAYASIFESQLFFEFETPKKDRSDCFLNLVSSEKKRLEVEAGKMALSEKRTRLLKLFSPSEDEDEQEESASDFQRTGSFEESLRRMSGDENRKETDLIINASFREYN